MLDYLMELGLKAGDWLLVIGDPLLGWMLHLPRDLTLVLLAVMTGVIMTVIRRFTTNQDLLRRCKEDKARLGVLMSEAKSVGDKERIKNIRMTNSQIALESFKAEGKPVLYSLLPIAILAIWAFSRISFMPPTAQDQIDVTLYFSEPQIGQLVTLLPEDGVTAHNGLLQQIGESRGLDGNIDGGMATWTVQCVERDEPYNLRFRYKGQLFEAQCRVDGLNWSPTQVMYNQEDVLLAEFKLENYKPLGSYIKTVDGWWQGYLGIFISWLGMGLKDILAPWLVGYLILVVPLTFILKPVLRTY